MESHRIFRKSSTYSKFDRKQLAKERVTKLTKRSRCKKSTITTATTATTECTTEADKEAKHPTENQEYGKNDAEHPKDGLGPENGNAMCHENVENREKESGTGSDEKDDEKNKRTEALTSTNTSMAPTVFVDVKAHLKPAICKPLRRTEFSTENVTNVPAGNPEAEKEIVPCSTDEKKPLQVNPPVLECVTPPHESVEVLVTCGPQSVHTLNGPQSVLTTHGRQSVPSGRGLQPLPSTREPQSALTGHGLQSVPSGRGPQPTPPAQGLQSVPSGRGPPPLPSARGPQPLPPAQGIQSVPSGRGNPPLPSAHGPQPSAHGPQPSAHGPQPLPTQQKLTSESIKKCRTQDSGNKMLKSSKRRTRRQRAATDDLKEVARLKNELRGGTRRRRATADQVEDIKASQEAAEQRESTKQKRSGTRRKRTESAVHR